MTANRPRTFSKKGNEAIKKTALPTLHH